VSWSIVASAIALLPMRLQYPPGLTLLVLAPVLIVWLGYDFGWLWAFAGTLGFVSMFRNPLRYLLGRALSRPKRSNE